MRAEHLRQWLAEAEDEKEPDDTNWRKVIWLVQEAFRSAELSQESMWSVLVLLPKGGGDFRGIGLIEVIWKVIEKITDRRISGNVEYHDVLHGFRSRRGCGTANIEAKLQQQLAAMRQEVLYCIFLDLHKAYDALDRDRALEILQQYGVGV